MGNTHRIAEIKGEALATGYKIFNWDWSANYGNYCYADENGNVEGSIHTMDGDLAHCKNGLHYCENPLDCYKYYAPVHWNKYAMVSAFDEVRNHNDGKSECRTLRIDKILSWDEFLGAITATAKVSGVSDGCGIYSGRGISNGDGIYSGKGISNSNGISDGSGISDGEGIYSGYGISSGFGISDGEGISDGRSISDGRGISNGYGIRYGKGISGGRGISNGYGISSGCGIRYGYGISGGNGISSGFGISDSDGISSSYGISGGDGIKNGRGICGGRGISQGYGISGGCGISNCYGVDESKYCRDCSGIFKCLLCFGYSGKLAIFNKPVGDARFREAENELRQCAYGWYPHFTNAEELRAKSDGYWAATPVNRIEGRKDAEAYADMPEALKSYIRSMPEYDERIFAKIIGGA